MKVFISSTSEDLLLHREAVASSLRTLRHHAEDMIMWGCDDRTPLEIAIEAVRQSDLFLSILAHRYGSIPAGHDRSYVELEFREAQEHKIPVLAFVIDEGHPWPPTFIDHDPDARAALRALKDEISAHCTRTLFTTAENLAITVTQAVANWDRRSQLPHGVPSPTWPTLHLSPRSTLRSKPNAVVPLGEDVDGSHLALRIRRSVNIDLPLQMLSKATGVPLEASPLAEVASVLRTSGHTKWSQSHINIVDVPGRGELPCYISRKNLSELFAPSMLTRLLPLPKGADGKSWSSKRERPPGSYAGIEEYQRTDRGTIHSTGGLNRFLAIPLTSPDLHAVGWPEQGQPRVGKPVYWRPFVPESLLAIEDVRFCLDLKSTRQAGLSALDRGHIRDFSRAMRKALAAKSANSDSRILVTFEVPRRSLCNVVVRIARSLEPTNRKGRIHGDLKPPNVLLAVDGPQTIDDVDLEVGTVAPLLSPGWAAPEQVTLDAVSMSTDVYPLGLMVCSALDAILSGEIVTHLVPGEHGNPAEVRFVRDPRVYLLMNSQVLSREVRMMWFEFLEASLRCDGTARIGSPVEFADGLSRLIESSPPHGDVKIVMSAETRMAKMPSGEDVICNILTDSAAGSENVPDDDETESEIAQKIWLELQPSY